VMVSAIITTHNRKALLKRAIESVLSQIYKDIECIVIDDASNDGTTDYISEYITENRIIYHRISEDESTGGNHARNVGISMARGKYIAFLDDDDEWLPMKIEEQVNCLIKNPGIQFVHVGGYKVYDSENGRTETVGNSSGQYIVQDFKREILTGIRTMNVAMMVEKALLLDVGGFDEKLKYLQEYELSIRLFQKTKAVYIDKPLYVVHINKADKKRLTNNVGGWERTLKIITNKHHELFDRLSQKEKTERKYYFLGDGIIRARNANDRVRLIKFYCMIFFDPRIDLMLLKRKMKK
jgi:glycosyltransferase involved in cell wall biosynthesis